MERHVKLEDISDGKLYELNDMVRADCKDCKGCSACCHDMGNTIILDPLDIHRLSMALGLTFEEMIDEKIELHIVDGMILPNLKMDHLNKSCVFLNSQGRCLIHNARPGICRLFPLGRYYENRGFKYFLQIHECRNENRTKIKIKKWIDTPDLKDNQKFIADWHYFLKDLQALVEKSTNEELRRKVTLYVLQTFYVNGYDALGDFYEQFNSRLEKAREIVTDTCG